MMQRQLLLACWVVAQGLVGCAVHTRTEDGGVDARENDAPPDAPRVDAQPLNCDDTLACTVDAVDLEGMCTHTLACPPHHACSATGECIATPACISNDTCVDLPCQPTLGCWGGHCRYEWEPDRDGDGAVDASCGGTDCHPGDPNYPGPEVCNEADDDCDGHVDENFDFSTSIEHCGQCNAACTGADACVAGACACTDPGAVTCTEGTPPWWLTYTCLDGQTNPRHCGACNHVCLEGSTCEAGLCRYRTTWGFTLDVPSYSLLVAPNGDVIVFTRRRPTLLTYDDARPAVSIPAGPTPFALYATRVSREGNLIGVTSLPPTVYGGAAISDEGFYWTGRVAADLEYFGERYRSERTPCVFAYVPRATSEVAWAVPIEGCGKVVALSNGDGVTAAENLGIIRFAPSGERREVTEVPENFRFNLGLFALRDGGFFTVTTGGGEDSPVPIFGAPYGLSAALRFDASGHPFELILMEGYTIDILDERVDREGWLMMDGDEAYEVSRRPTRSLLGRGNGQYAVFDEGGFAILGNDYTIQRWRDGIEVERVVIPGTVSLTQGSVWTINGNTVGRVTLPPIR